jgi:hypothetical protein
LRKVGIRDHFRRCGCGHLGLVLTILTRNIAKRLAIRSYAGQKKECHDGGSKVADMVSENLAHNSPFEEKAQSGIMLAVGQARNRVTPVTRMEISRVADHPAGCGWASEPVKAQ